MWRQGVYHCRMHFCPFQKQDLSWDRERSHWLDISESCFSQEQDVLRFLERDLDITAASGRMICAIQLHVTDDGGVWITEIDKVKDIVAGRDLFCFTSHHVTHAHNFLHVIRSSSADEVRARVTMTFSSDNDTDYYASIDAGWNSVKVRVRFADGRSAFDLNSHQLVGITIIPYCWCILPSAFLWNVLMAGAVLDICHCLLVFTVYLVPYLSPSTDVTGIWTAQAIVAGGVRIIEIVYNARILGALQGKVAAWQYVWFAVASAFIIAGRVLDVYFVSKATVWQDVRIGMAVVSMSGVLAAVPVIWALGCQVYHLLQSEYYQQSQGRIRIIMQQSSVRLIFLNAIDVGLVFCFLLPNTVAAPFFRWWFDNWDNSRLSYYCVDLLLSRVNMQDAASSTHKKRAVGATVDLKATEFEGSSELHPPTTSPSRMSRKTSNAATDLLGRLSTHEIGTRYEHAVVAYLNAHGFRVSGSGKRGDEGVDFLGHLCGGSSDISVLGQCKAWSKPLSANPVQAFAGMLTSRNAAGGGTAEHLGVVASESGFTAKCIEWVLQYRQPLVLMTLRRGRQRLQEQTAMQDEMTLHRCVVNDAAQARWPGIQVREWRVGSGNIYYTLGLS
ncbi:hypothetical protein RI367_004767 [Sorochytrium milnesiophthora]